MDLLQLWLPILLSAAAVWIVSMVASMALPHHRQDWIGLPPEIEDGFMDDLRKRGAAGGGLKPGNYLFPDFRSRAQLESEKVKKALETGPVGHLSLWKTPVTMGDKMVGTLLVYLVASTLIAYLARVAIPPVPPNPTAAASFAKVFQVVATAGILTYCFAHIPSALWWGSSKRTIIANIVDGILYAAITGAIFAWRWPR